MDLKRCTGCRRLVPCGDYYRHTTGRLQSECKACHSARSERNRLRRKSEDPERFRARKRAYNRRRLYGLTEEDLNSRLAAQDFRCAICRIQPDHEWNIDHDHSCCPGDRSCGKCVRGILCSGCNRGLAAFRDNPDRLVAASTYIHDHQRITI